MFPVEVKPQDPAKPVVLELQLELGICREICIPGEVQAVADHPAVGAVGCVAGAAWLRARAAARSPCAARAIPSSRA